MDITIPAGSLCTYEFIPNIDAGPQDVMKIDFTSVTEVERATPAPTPNAKTPSMISKEANPDKVQLAYAVGTEYLIAQGGITAEVKDKAI